MPHPEHAPHASAGSAADAGGTPTQNPVQEVEIIVVGAGFAGIAVGIKLREAGIHDFVILDKAQSPGGVWRDNTYPGCACDVPSALYSYSFAPKPDWQRVFAPQEDIRRYLQETAEQHGLRPHFRFGQEVQEARWCEAEARWHLRTSQGEWRARFAVMACGPMHEPSVPDLPGLKDFPGEIFHSSAWRHDVSLKGRRVAVIGTGASAIQFVPAIQPHVGHMTVFQRTPQWILPKADLAISPWAQKLFKLLPVTQKIMRASVYATFESLNGGMRHPALMGVVRALARHNIHRSIRDPEMRRKLTPNYTPGCKRILQSNNWYPALSQPNVSLVSHGVKAVEGRKVIASDGSVHEVDAIVLGTGFEITAPPVADRIRGRSGKTVAERWQGSPQGYLGTMVLECPNAFLMIGPNLAVSSSAVIIIEAQLAYIVDAIKQARRDGLRTIEPDPKVHDEYNRSVQEALQKTVWNNGGCSSYFLDRNGRNSTAWPWTTFEMRRRLSHFQPEEHKVVRS
jgi:cation diffusion facilitator CzcD-associated flavoprotein CzcO